MLPPPVDVLRCTLPSLKNGGLIDSRQPRPIDKLLIGIALAVPLVAIGRIAVLRFYVEDCLQDEPLARSISQDENSALQPAGAPGRS